MYNPNVKWFTESYPLGWAMLALAVGTALIGIHVDDAHWLWGAVIAATVVVIDIIRS